MMTIKEFAKLCGCNTQTLRYYDKIDLLKPVKVNQWSSYRYYAKSQAIDFVKIKNLQAADFTIDEIKKLIILSEIVRTYGIAMAGILFTNFLMTFLLWKRDMIIVSVLS